MPAPFALPAGPVPADAADVLRILGLAYRPGRLTHVARVPARDGRQASWPSWVPAELVAALSARGVGRPWQHQAAAARLAHSGHNVIIATSAASGKSLGYLLPALAIVLNESRTALYLAPTRALAADQLRMVDDLGTGVRAAVINGETPQHQREWARSHVGYLLTTPDTLHSYLLPRHARWAGFFRRLRYVVVDECHAYRGVFGSHTAQVLRRLRRVAGRYGADPVFVMASATIGEPARCARLLTGLDAVAVTADSAPRGSLTLALWEPPLTRLRGEAGAPVRRAATAEAAAMLADLVAAGVPTLAFVRSRRGAETVAMATRRLLAEAGAADLAPRVAAYRSGYLPDDRRALEEAVKAGAITGLSATSALELGVNLGGPQGPGRQGGLGAVLIAGWPGTRAALWQQAGRAGRGAEAASAVLIARDDPLDTYLVHHPEAILDRPVEATVLDPDNPYVLGPHLCAAAAEMPLQDADLGLFGDTAAEVAGRLRQAGLLRRRGDRWCWAGRGRPPPDGLRGTGGPPVRIVEEPTGRLVGTVDEPSAHLLVHTGAVYPHQGEIYLVERLDLADRIALVTATDPGYTTSVRERTGVEITATLRQADWGTGQVAFGDVRVSRQVTSFARRNPDTGRPVEEVPLDLPPRTLQTRAVWWTLEPPQRDRLAADGADLPGAAHAAEHAAIGLLPLVASCDRWDVGGISADPHPATGRLTVLVYDGYDGGAGFAERGYRAAASWLSAALAAIESCECTMGCPSCVQSPKCGNGNEPLSKHGAILLLRCLLDGRPAG